VIAQEPTNIVEELSNRAFAQQRHRMLYLVAACAHADGEPLPILPRSSGAPAQHPRQHPAAGGKQHPRPECLKEALI